MQLPMQFPCANCRVLLAGPYNHVAREPVPDLVSGYGGFLFPYVCEPEGHCSDDGGTRNQGG